MTDDRPAVRQNQRTPLLALGAACLAIYTLSFFYPPPAQPPAMPAADAGLLTRLFPGVPPWWSGSRLLLLFVGAGLLARYLVLPPPRLMPSVAAPFPSPTSTGAALALSLILPIVSLFADRFSHSAQVGFLVALFVPGAVAWIAQRPPRQASSTKPSPVRWQAVVTLGLVLLWGIWRMWAVWHSPRTASVVDIWLNNGYMVDAIRQGTNLLRSWHQSAVSNAHLLFTGLALFPGNEPPSLATIQALGIFWMAVAALLIAWCTARIVSVPAGWVAATAVLFAPLSLSLTAWPYPLAIVAFLPPLLLALWLVFERTRSTYSLLWLAAAAGVTATQATVMASVPPAAVATLWSLRRSPRPPRAMIVAAVLIGIAGFLPSIPGLEWQGWRAEYVDSQWQWDEIENVVLDQRSPVVAPTITELEFAGRPGPFDIVLGGLLAPFATPRTPIRLTGDSLLDPLAAALGAVGMLLCLRRRGATRPFLALLAAWLFIQLPVMVTSKYDRASIARNLALPVVSAPFVGLAFEAVRASWPAGAGVALPLVIAGSALAGTVVFECINPRLLATSSMELIFEATDGPRPPGGVALLDIPDLEYRNVDKMVAQLPRSPLPVIQFRDGRDLSRDEAQPASEVFFWTTTVEQECHVSRAICSRWPTASILQLRSRSEISRAFGAMMVEPSPWQPAIPPERWSRVPCAEWVDPFPGEARQVICNPEIFRPVERKELRQQGAQGQ